MKTCFKLCACTYSSAFPLRSYRLTLASYDCYDATAKTLVYQAK